MGEPHSLAERLADAVPGLIAAHDIAGLSVALVEDGTLAWAAGFGLADREAKVPVTPATLFQAASLTKPVFACGVLQLWQAGELDLDAPLTDMLPEPYLSDEPRLVEITARRVLCHTPGFPNWRSENEPLHAAYPPGTRFSYSGEGYVYLQRVVEHLTGQPLARWIKTQVLDPAGMQNSGFVWEARFEGRLATAYAPGNKRVEKAPMTTANAAYSLVTTPSDYARLVAAMLGEAALGGALAAPTLAAMFAPQIAVNDVAPWHDDWPDVPVTQEWDDVAWGLGWGLQLDPRGVDSRGSSDKPAPIFWHWGDNDPYTAFVMGDRTRGRALVAMANGREGLRVWPPLFGLVFGSELAALDWLLGMYAQMH